MASVPRKRNTPQPAPRVLYKPPSGRQTVPPKFDMEQFARESDARIRSATETDPPPSSEAAPVVDVEPVTDGDAASVYWARIGDADQVVVCLLSSEDVLRVSRAAGEGFILSLVDGERSVRAILRACALPPLSALSALCGLLEAGVLATRAP